MKWPASLLGHLDRIVQRRYAIEALGLMNKIFIYLLAGIPVLLSNTPAQRELAAELGDAARVVDLTDPDATAAALDTWASDPDALARAKRKAWRLGQTRFNWGIEQQHFLRRVKETLA